MVDGGAFEQFNKPLISSSEWRCEMLNEGGFKRFGILVPSIYFSIQSVEIMKIGFTTVNQVVVEELEKLRVLEFIADSLSQVSSILVSKCMNLVSLVFGDHCASQTPSGSFCVSQCTNLQTIVVKRNAFQHFCRCEYSGSDVVGF